MKTILFKCPPGGQFHFGRIATDDKTSLDDTTTIYHSDTLASAIVETAYKAMPTIDLADKVRDWFKAGKVRFSSLLYCLEKTTKDKTLNHIFFLPKPVHLDAGEHSDQKRVVQVMAISKGVWEAGLLPKEWWDEVDDKGNTVKASPCVVLDRKFVVLKTELTLLGSSKLSEKFKLFELDTVPKVKIHQPKKEDNLYFHGNVFLSKQRSPSVHFYALVEHTLDENDWKLLWSLLELLADEGIGGERSVGCGRLKGVKDLGDFNLDIKSASPRSCTLNLVSPNGQADLDRLKAWRLVTRGGRHTMQDGDLKRLKMLAEGALTEAGLEGGFHNLGTTARQAYLRFGYPVTLSLSKNYGEYGKF